MAQIFAEIATKPPKCEKCLPRKDVPNLAHLSLSIFFSVPLFLWDGPTTTTPMIFKKNFSSDGTSNCQLMAQQMKNHCVFSVLHCVEVGIRAASRGAPKREMGLRENNSKMVVILFGPSLSLGADVWEGDEHSNF